MVWLGLSEFYFGAQTREKGESSSYSGMTGGVYYSSLSDIFADSCSSTTTFADDRELSGSRCTARKRGIGRPLVMNIVIGLITLAFWNPSLSVTTQRVFHDGHLTFFANKIVELLKRIGIASSFLLDNPKYSVTLFRISPPTLFTWCSIISSPSIGDWMKIAVVLFCFN